MVSSIRPASPGPAFLAGQALKGRGIEGTDGTTTIAQGDKDAKFAMVITLRLSCLSCLSCLSSCGAFQSFYFSPLLFSRTARA